MEEQSNLQYIEFTYGKLGKVRKIKWDPELGEPVFRRKFIYLDEYGEDYGMVLKPIPTPDEPVARAVENIDPEFDDYGGNGEISPTTTLVDGMAVRYITDDDERIIGEIKLDEPQHLETCKERVKHHGLKMKMLATDIRFDRKKITFHFAADGRVDFRMLVRDLASIFRCRIELHQIGARDEASLYVGIGQCGRKLCCRSWLKDFKTIGIKMARAQNLPLNPGKISGNCGRLLCCLSYEYEMYLELAETLPRIGEHTEIDGIPHEVIYISPLNQTVTLQCLREEERHKRVKVSAEQYLSGTIKPKK